MFAVIETKGANHIIINIPHEGSEASLPALARMLEQNAVFVNVAWREMSVTKPAMSIVLGDNYQIDGHDELLAVAKSGAVLPDDFVNATPEVFVSNAKQRKRHEDEEARLRAELTYTKNELDRIKAQLAELTAEQE